MLDLPYMAELLGAPGEYSRITTELSGVIFKDPMSGQSYGWRSSPPKQTQSLLSTWMR